MSVVVEEIVPATDPSTRTVLVKAALPEGTGARPGSFARLAIPTGAERVLVVPSAAIESVGQIETVRVVGADGVRAINVRTGARGLGSGGELVEVLAGLHAGDQVVVPGACHESEPTGFTAKIVDVFDVEALAAADRLLAARGRGDAGSACRARKNRRSSCRWRTCWSRSRGLAHARSRTSSAPGSNRCCGRSTASSTSIRWRALARRW